MNILPWLLFAALTCLLAFQTTRRTQRTKLREQAHETLVNRVKRLRLYKMLKFLGADQDEYLRTVPMAEINRQIHRCSQCKEPEVCDRHLGDGKRVDNLDFCPNQESLAEQSKTIHQSRLK